MSERIIDYAKKVVKGASRGVAAGSLLLVGMPAHPVAADVSEFSIPPGGSRTLNAFCGGEGDVEYAVGSVTGHTWDGKGSVAFYKIVDGPVEVKAPWGSSGVCGTNEEVDQFITSRQQAEGQAGRNVLPTRFVGPGENNIVSGIETGGIKKYSAKPGEIFIATKGSTIFGDAQVLRNNNGTPDFVPLYDNDDSTALAIRVNADRREFLSNYGAYVETYSTVAEQTKALNEWKLKMLDQNKQPVVWDENPPTDTSAPTIVGR